jgi:endophilin-A
MPFFENITKVKPSADPQSSGKEKVLLTEALGLVMIDYGGDVKDAFGEYSARPQSTNH